MMTPEVSAHVVLLTNFIPPHQLPVHTELSRRVGKLTILVSTPMEPDRDWSVQWGSLDVRVQRTWTLKSSRRHPVGFLHTAYIHIPWDTTRQLQQLRPDVIVSLEFGVRSLLSARYKARSPHTALVIYTGLSQHSERARGRARDLLRKWLIRRADCVTANGRDGMEYLRRMGAPAENVVYFPYAAVPDALYRGAVTRQPALSHRLLYVGRFIELKGLLPFFQTLAAWAIAHPQRRVEFQLVGSGPLQSQLQSFQMPGNVAVQFLGTRTVHEIAEIYAGAGIFVFPTLSDEWGLVVNEAMAAGLPVLGSLYSQAVEELCIEGETGWTFRPDKPEEMAGALDRALGTSPERLHVMRVAARARVEPITPAYAAECLLEAIRAALERCAAQREAAAVSRGKSRGTSLRCRRGELVEVRALEEILATLDADGKLEGMPFIPEMARFCGRRFRIDRRADKTCVEGHRLRRLKNTVFLEGLRCDGSQHDGCQRNCLVFWKTAWLKPALATATAQAADRPDHAPAEGKLSVTRNGRYYCQSTELAAATAALSRWNPWCYLQDLLVGEATPAVLAGIVWRTLRNKARQLLRRGAGSQKVRTPKGALGLEAGEWVEIRSREEIEATLDGAGKNRGLSFESDMLEHCGRQYRVAFPVRKIICEETGKMVPLAETVVLEGVTCRGSCARNCPRSNYFYWREIWLKRP